MDDIKVFYVLRILFNIYIYIQQYSFKMPYKHILSSAPCAAEKRKNNNNNNNNKRIEGDAPETKSEDEKRRNNGECAFKGIHLIFAVGISHPLRCSNCSRF